MHQILICICLNAADWAITMSNLPELPWTQATADMQDSQWTAAILGLGTKPARRHILETLHPP